MLWKQVKQKEKKGENIRKIEKNHQRRLNVKATARQSAHKCIPGHILIGYFRLSLYAILSFI